MIKPLFIEVTASERVEILFRKSRTKWLTQEELGELIKIRDTKEDVSVSNLASYIIKEQNDKMCGRKHW